MTHWTEGKEVPFKAWYVDDVFRIEEVEVIKMTYHACLEENVFDFSDGRGTSPNHLFSSPEDAIEAGRSGLASMKFQIDEWSKTYKQRRVNLKVAEERFGVSKCLA